ncbi:MAG: ribonuclease P protein component [Desulfobulbaceae bacterium]|nr:ribonuclease P protein component [Desulfobulbaceae bacterium]
MVNQRLSKAQLVRKGWEYKKVYSRGKRLHGEGFTLVCLSNETDDSRLGISVHRKIRGAVRRNRIKRIIRESFRLERKQFPEGMDIVFAVRPDFALKNPSEICRAVGNITAGFTCYHNS